MPSSTPLTTIVRRAACMCAVAVTQKVCSGSLPQRLDSIGSDPSACRKVGMMTHNYLKVALKLGGRSLSSLLPSSSRYVLCRLLPLPRTSSPFLSRPTTNQSQRPKKPKLSKTNTPTSQRRYQGLLNPNIYASMAKSIRSKSKRKNRTEFRNTIGTVRV